MRLSKWCRRHGLRRCCNGQGEARNSNQSDHLAPPLTLACSKSFRRLVVGPFEVDQGPGLRRPGKQLARRARGRQMTALRALHHLQLLGKENTNVA
jgi:hypothetical protein